MNQRTRSVSISIVAALALVAAGACSSKASKTTTAPDTGRATAVKKTSEPIVQEAAGEIRDLLLTLRRVHFAFDSNKLTPQARQALEDAVDKLARLPQVHLYVEGNADERGTTEYNIALADGRARTVADFLIAMGIDMSRLHVVSMGEENPLVAGHTPIAYAKNRRVDFRLMRGGIQFVLADGDLVDDAGAPIAGN